MANCKSINPLLYLESLFFFNLFIYTKKDAGFLLRPHIYLVLFYYIRLRTFLVQLCTCRDIVINHKKMKFFVL